MYRMSHDLLASVTKRFPSTASLYVLYMSPKGHVMGGPRPPRDLKLSLSLTAISVLDMMCSSHTVNKLDIT